MQRLSYHPRVFAGLILERGGGIGRLRIEDGFDFTLSAILIETLRSGSDLVNSLF